MLDMTPTERVGRITWILAQGGQVTVRHVADALEMTPRGARYLLERLSTVVPLVDDGGVWRVMERDPYEYDDPAEIRAALARQEAKRVFGENDNGQ